MQFFYGLGKVRDEFPPYTGLLPDKSLHFLSGYPIHNNAVLHPGANKLIGHWNRNSSLMGCPGQKDFLPDGFEGDGGAIELQYFFSPISYTREVLPFPIS